MNHAQRPQTSHLHCPRCDEELTVSLVGQGSGRGLMLACPEPYCDYVWAPTRGELTRLAPLDRSRDQGLDPDRVARAAG